MPYKMNILAMADESTFVGHRKYFRWHLKVLAFFEALFFGKAP